MGQAGQQTQAVILSTLKAGSKIEVEGNRGER